MCYLWVLSNRFLPRGAGVGVRSLTRRSSGVGCDGAQLLFDIRLIFDRPARSQRVVELRRAIAQIQDDREGHASAARVFLGMAGACLADELHAALLAVALAP